MSVKKVNQILIGDELYPIDDKNDEVIKTIELTYTELVELRDNAQLVPGQSYRITDYVTTIIDSYIRSAGHPFDIIVTALDNKTLSEDARAIQHEGDTYFANSNLSAWKLKYCLDNDANRFRWIEEQAGVVVNDIKLFKDNREVETTVDGETKTLHIYNKVYGLDALPDSSNMEDVNVYYNITGSQWGLTQYKISSLIFSSVDKGVIYYMKDEFENECPYDFKNILYPRTFSDTTGGTTKHCPTFTRKSLISYSQWGNTYAVKETSLEKTLDGIKYYRYAISELNRPSAWSSDYFYITDEIISSSSVMYSFDEDTQTMNTINFGGTLTVYESFDTSLNGDTNFVYKNKITSRYERIYRDVVIDKQILNDIVFIGGDNFENILNNCEKISFANKCQRNILSNCYNLEFEKQCVHLKIINAERIVIKDNSINSSVENHYYADSNMYINNCTILNSKGIKGKFYGCHLNDCEDITTIDYIQNGVFENGVKYISFTENNSTYYNIKVCSGVSGSSTLNPLIITPLSGVTSYQQIFTAKGSTTTEVEVNE